MTEEQVQQALDKLDTRLADILAILQQIADDLKVQRDELKDEIAAVNALPRQFQRGLPTDAAREYLAGRWKRIPGNAYPAPPQRAANIHEYDPSGPVRPPGVSRD